MTKKEMGIDVETYSGTSIKDGVYAYVDDPDFEIMLITYVDPYRKNEDNTPIYYTFVPEKFAQRHPGKVDPNDCNPEAERRFRYLLMDAKVKKTAFNANFERTTLAAYYNEISCPPEQWQCTMVLAATLGYPHSLEKVGEVMDLGEDKKKEKIGKELIRYFSAPVKPTKKNDHRTRNLPMDDPEKWNQFKEYNHQDVVAEQAIYQALKKYTPNEKEKAFWDMDQRINDRGIRIDVPFVEQIVAFDKAEQERKLKEMKELTGLDNPNSAAQLKKWLAENGAPEFKDSLRQEDIKEALEKGTYQDKPKIEKALRGRLETSKSSIKKYYTMLNTMDEEGRCKGMFQFYGASRTGRWAGRRLQLQNLAKNKIEDLDEVRSAVARGDWESVRKKYPDTADIESQLVRTALVPSKGNRFIVTDFSAIEARVIAWIAGEEWRLKAFENGEDIYCVSASKIFGVPVEKHGVNSELRAQGKVAELACGYQGWIGAMKRMDFAHVINDEEKYQTIVQEWRDASPNIVNFWTEIEKKTCKILREEPICQDVGMEQNKSESILIPNTDKKLKLYYEDHKFWIQLPSGRAICYPEAYEGPNPLAKNQITFQGTDNQGNWVTIETYGGKLTENVVQAIARDCLAEKMMKAEKEGFQIVAHIHDEMVLDVPNDEHFQENFNKIDALMAEPIDWAPGLPLKGGTYACDYYRKD